ncbi:heme ABC exporter ATP-binding protein CcmA [Microvirga sp. W0021]|uniref:Heme ABC exporter ATP-binding protein CcmA n=1 Tax=Hohaiivirga grylli TaxID=3133970 RepID=A0ABV0BGY5_9HYPH
MQLIVENLKCIRGGRRIFDNVSFKLEEGQSLVVTGRNGAGKSTLLAILSGRLKASGGTIHLSGVQDRTLPECLHLIGHKEALKAVMTARENLDFAAEILGNPALSTLEALEHVGLVHAADMPVAYLSAGQKRRVALARLLVAHRPLWLLDEPTSALDTASQKILFNMMNKHVEKGGMIMAATHQEMPLVNLRELRIERPAPQEIDSDMMAGGF